MKDEKLFNNALFEVVDFILDEDLKELELSDSLKNELEIHGASFLLRAKIWLDAENEKRIQNDQELKTIQDLAHDFIFTALGCGVGFWEHHESDWLYYNDTLNGLAEKYFYSGYSFYSGDDGFIYGG